MERLVDFPSTRVAPVEVLASLRRLDPTIEAFWWGPRVFRAQDAKGATINVVKPCWIVGSVLPTEMALLKWGEAITRRWPYRHRPEMYGDIRMLMLRYRGFRPIILWPHRDLDSSVVNELELRNWYEQHYLREEIDRRYRETTMEDQLAGRQAHMAEAVQAEMKDIWKYVWKGRRSILVN